MKKAATTQTSIYAAICFSPGLSFGGAFRGSAESRPDIAKLSQLREAACVCGSNWQERNEAILILPQGVIKLRVLRSDFHEGLVGEGPGAKTGVSVPPSFGTGGCFVCSILIR